VAANDHSTLLYNQIKNKQITKLHHPPKQQGKPKHTPKHYKAQITTKIRKTFQHKIAKTAA